MTWRGTPINELSSEKIGMNSWEIVPPQRMWVSNIKAGMFKGDPTLFNVCRGQETILQFGLGPGSVFSWWAPADGEIIADSQFPLRVVTSDSVSWCVYGSGMVFTKDGMQFLDATYYEETCDQE